jgi:hypothetical protein
VITRIDRYREGAPASINELRNLEGIERVQMNMAWYRFGRSVGRLEEFERTNRALNRMAWVLFGVMLVGVIVGLFSFRGQ